MRDQASADSSGAKAPSPLRLRIGVLLILIWWAPIWALAPAIAHALDGLSNPPSVAGVTTDIVIDQTVIGLLGFVVAGTAVKGIVKGSRKRDALRAIWGIFLHGEIRPKSPISTTVPPPK